MALALGERLAYDGFDIIYTRTSDVYDSPLQKTQMANTGKADLFVSLHRNFGPVDNSYHGIRTLVYQEYEEINNIANAINTRLTNVGFLNLGIDERPGLVVLHRALMPAILIEDNGIIGIKVVSRYWQGLRSEK
jgi:N-acetylmuramoyl-L-alanine amidase